MKKLNLYLSIVHIKYLAQTEGSLLTTVVLRRLIGKYCCLNESDALLAGTAHLPNNVLSPSQRFNIGYLTNELP